MTVPATAITIGLRRSPPLSGRRGTSESTIATRASTPTREPTTVGTLGPDPELVTVPATV